MNKVLGINERNLRAVYPNNSIRNIRTVGDKIMTKELLTKAGVPVPPTKGVLGSMLEMPRLPQFLHEGSAVKPSGGMGGGGILLIEEQAPVEGTRLWRTLGGHPIDLLDLEQHAAEILHGQFSFGDEDRLLVEELLVPHPEVYRWAPCGLADLRMIYLHDRLLVAMLRMPTQASDGKANLHQGGVAAGVDMETGEMGAVYNGAQHGPCHPDGTQVEGLMFPNWKDVLEVGALASSVSPVRYVGVDIVMDATRGPVVLELNARPGLEIQNVCREGLRPKIVPR